jgi:hypothetical protein
MALLLVYIVFFLSFHLFFYFYLACNGLLYRNNAGDYRPGFPFLILFPLLLLFICLDTNYDRLRRAFRIVWLQKIIRDVVFCMHGFFVGFASVCFCIYFHISSFPFEDGELICLYFVSL